MARKLESISLNTDVRLGKLVTPPLASARGRNERDELLSQVSRSINSVISGVSLQNVSINRELLMIKRKLNEIVQQLNELIG